MNQINEPIKISDDIQKKLLSYQIQHVDNLVYSLGRYKRALDASDTGTGKTYSAIASAASLKLKPLIICPKSVISSWKQALDYFKIDYYGVTNYELIKNCKYYTEKDKYERVKCPYIERMRVKKTDKKGKEKEKFIFKWKLPNDVLLIFDEAHRCKNKKTTTSDILFTAGASTSNILLLSATISDKPENFEVAGYTLGLYQSLKNSKSWMQSAGNEYDNIMQGVHDRLYPEYASRMRIRDLGDLFPVNQVLAECYDMENAKEIEEQYKAIEDAVEQLKKEESQTDGLGKIIKARQRIEMLKVPTYVEMAKDYLEQGLAVAIFVNFTDSLKTIAEQLKTTCVVHGQQTMEQRDMNIASFKDDTSHVIICNIRAGGVGISLHDEHGNFPRISIISPSWSAQDIVQALGRVHRAKTKTPVRQRIVFCKGTIEETICKNVKGKIVNIGSLNDGNTLSYQYEGLIDEEVGIDKNEGLSEFEKMFQRINVLHAKKIRLELDLNETKEEIENLEAMLANAIEEQ